MRNINVIFVLFFAFVNAGLAQNELVIQVTSDNYPQETSWKLYDLSGNIIDMRDTFTKNEQHTDTIALNADNCYYWTIYDAYGDGMSRNEDAGFKLFFNEKEIGASSSPNFGDSASVYSIGGACSANETMLNRISTLANLSKDTATIRADVLNIGAEIINSISASYTINNETPVVHEFTDLNIEVGEFFELKMPEPYNFENAGEHVISFSINTINGIADNYTSNNSLLKTVKVVDGYIRKNLMEIFTTAGQGCSPCYNEVQNFYNEMDGYFETFDFVNYMTWDFADKKWNEDIKELKLIYDAFGLSNIRFNMLRVYNNGSDFNYTDSLGLISPFKIVANGQSIGDSIKVSCTITTSTDIDEPIYLRGVLNETTCYDVAYEYINDKPYKNVALAFTDGVYGYKIEQMKAGESLTFNRTFSYNEFHIEKDTYKDLNILFYAQDRISKKIMQSASVKLKHTHIPYDISFNIEQNATNVNSDSLTLQINCNRKLYSTGLGNILNYHNHVIFKTDNELGVDVPVEISIDSLTNALNIKPKYGWLPNTTYYFNLVDLITVESDTVVAPFVFTTADETTVAINNTANTFNIYPNPANQHINIETTNTGTAQIIMPNGIIIRKLKIEEGKNQIHIGDLKTGIYFIQFNTTDEVKSVKFIKH